MKAGKFALNCLRIADSRLKYYNNRLTYPYRSYEAMEYLLRNEQFETVLDVGCGEGIHSDIFLKNGKKVTAIDYGESVYFKKNENDVRINTIIGDINTYSFNEQFDLVWCSHVLEHQLNVHDFLTKIHTLCKEDGILAITVPPYKPDIVGGHVSMWNPGLLLYNLILAGFDCRDAHVKVYDYDISVIVRKRSISVLDMISYDAGDIKALWQYFPSGGGVNPVVTKYDYNFNGNIAEINWDLNSK